MAYTLTLNSISPTTAVNTGNIGLVVNFNLLGSGVSLPGSYISLYDSPTGGTLVKSLYSDNSNDLQSGMAYSVSFTGVSPGTYYVEVFFQATGTPRKPITITGASSDIELITLNGNKVTSNSLNGSPITSETVNGFKVYYKTLTSTLQWQFVGQYSSEPGNYDMFFVESIFGDYQEGLDWININYPAGDGDEGFVAIILDEETQEYFEYVIVET